MRRQAGHARCAEPDTSPTRESCMLRQICCYVVVVVFVCLCCQIVLYHCMFMLRQTVAYEHWRSEQVACSTPKRFR